ncbi:hypothetical protein NliqN6_2926 [Naganishia liquefaciens]|uniref:Nitrate/nitrite transporter n=1 Tax=Naganishia liquefaciens TaxID=104408 RepID=A0A8H3TUR7_9TREE|nr:hypothetical protein NliqN6_2926 [Naganishia liquefaciens]
MKNVFCLGAPPVNPLNGKAQKLPIINPFNKYGRVFFFSWASFCCSFAAWYSFSPLAKSIRATEGFTNVQWLNSNIVALLAGMCMRAIVGPCCDRFGPRKTMTCVLIAAAIPCGLAGLIKNYTGLLLIRFFVGIAGASFVPCLTWCTLFYDKGVVGTANGFAAGWGNAGAGVTYFMMPAVYDSLKGRGLSSSKAWRVSFVVPTILLLLCAAGSFFLCEDTPTGKWEDRFTPKTTITEQEIEEAGTSAESIKEKSSSEKMSTQITVQALESGHGETNAAPTLKMEEVKKPSLKDSLKAVMCMQTLMLAAPYACSFGGELALNSVLGPWYQQSLGWNQTKSGQVAAAFGLFNVISRPMGGVLADWLYAYVSPSRGTKTKQVWYGFLVAAQGVMLIWTGALNPHSPAVLVGGVMASALFMDAANGAAYSLVPHVNPQYNGIMSGLVGATGNMGGVLFSVGYRFTNYHKGTWILGVVAVAIGVLMTIVKPIPKKQLLAGGYMSQ